MLELTGNAARDNKKNRIVTRHIQLVVREDEELKMKHKGFMDGTIQQPAIDDPL